MLDRRGFLKFIGGAAVGTLATPVVWKGLDDISIWSQNWPWIPSLQYGNHENTYVRTVSKLCPPPEPPKSVVGGRPCASSAIPRARLAAASPRWRHRSPMRPAGPLKRPLLRNSDGGYGNHLGRG
ncbi:MAG: twin-arginine translocation signal domain-containing protein [Bilophila wadsworthia]